MSLIAQKGKSIISEYINLILDEWKSIGNIGNGDPKNKEMALKQVSGVVPMNPGRRHKNLLAKGK